MPHTSPVDRPYRLARHRRRRGRLKIERININQAPEVEMTYQIHANAAQPPRNNLRRAYGVYRPRRRRGRIKITPINISRALEIEKTHPRRVNALWSMRRPGKQIGKFSKLTVKCRMQGSANMMSRTTDELLRSLQSMHICQRDTTSKSGNNAEVINSRESTELKYHSNWTHSFALV